MKSLSAFICCLFPFKVLLAAQEEGFTFPFDLNKSPPASPQKGATQISNVPQSSPPLEQSDTNVDSQHSTVEVEKRKRRPKRKYDFPPGTSLKEKQRVWVRTFQAALVSLKKSNDVESVALIESHLTRLTLIAPRKERRI